MRKSLIFVTLVAALALGGFFVAQPEAQRAALTYVLDGTRATVPDRLILANSFTAQTATGQTASLLSNSALHSIHLVVTGGPATCTYRLQGSNNNTTWFDLSASDITCTSSIASYEATKPAVYVRGDLKTLTGGTTPSVTLLYAGR
jgi:hypothetical protein